MKKVQSFYTQALLLMSVFSGPLISAQAVEYRLSSFEKKPAAVTYSPSSKVSLNDEKYKAGKQSLKWQFKSGDSLTFNENIGYQAPAPNSKSKAQPTYMTWIYNPKAIKQQLRFEFLTKNQVNSWFEMSLNFVGWRAIAIPFDTDMQGTPGINMNQLKIIAPNVDGEIYFDLMALCLPVDPRWPTPDYQVPFVNKNIAKRANAHWGALLQYDHWLQENTFKQKAPTDVTPIFQKIELRIDEDLLATSKRLNRKQTNNLLKKGRKLAFINRETLRPVQMWRQLEVYQHAPLAKALLKDIKSQTLRFQKLGKHLLNLAKAYRKSDNDSLKKKLLAQFTLLSDHLLDQGFVRGSAIGIMHHQGYAIREWAEALFLMRNQLNNTLSQQRQAIAWFTGLGRIFKPESEINGFNVDVMNTFLPAMVMSILMEEDNNQKTAFLAQLSHWMSYSTLAIKGLSGGIQADGSFYHHSQHYVAYGNGGLKGLSPVVYYLSHTPFALETKAYQRLKHAVMMSSKFSNGLKVPMSLSGRHPEKYIKISLAPFKYLAMIGDKEIASTYLRLMNVDASKLQNSPVTPELTPNGSWVMNFSSLAIHRRDEWLATARGFSRYLVGNESYSKANHYGRYMNFGHVEIFPSATIDSGFSEPGWDWNRWSGTTTEHLPFEKLQANIRQVDEFSGVEEMLLSDESYSGAVHLNNQSAVFAMKLHGHAKYQSDLRANKSVFFFDNRIIALGSNISSTSDFPVETTLFQQTLTSTDTATFENGQALQGLSLQKSAYLTEPSYYRDTRSNAYFIPKGHQIKLLRQQQGSFDNENKKPTQGQFATLLIDHGKSPTDGQYQYAILIGADNNQSKLFNQALQSNQPPFTVLRKDRVAHIVEDHQSNSTGYALFEPTDKLNNKLIHAVDTPVILLSKQQNNNLSLAVTNPDLNLYHGQESDQLDEHGQQKEVSIYSRKWRNQSPVPTQVKITLKGQWQGEGTNYQTLVQDNNLTIVTINTVAGAPIQLDLQQLN